MIDTAMKHLLLFILCTILAISHVESYIHPHDINHAFFTQKVHRARRCHDDCSLNEFKGDY
jgi:hypothetical protein